jgi:5'-3' exonuclease
LDVYLVDGTYELFRHFYAMPAHSNEKGEEVAATRGVLGSIAGMLESGVTHIGVATDHVIESFRNDLWPGYKTSEGVDPRLLAQFPLLEEALEAMGVVVWPMVELEADDAPAGAASSLSKLSSVSRVYICTPDKDLAQSVQDDRVVQLDRRARRIRNEEGVREKFGVLPKSIPDYLALVGDAADGYSGLTGWGERSAGSVIGFYDHLEAVPRSAVDWKVQVRGADRLANTLYENFKLALLFRDLATLRTKEPRIRSPKLVHWGGPKPTFEAICRRLGDTELSARVAGIARNRQSASRTSHSIGQAWCSAFSPSGNL